VLSKASHEKPLLQTATVYKLPKLPSGRTTNRRHLIWTIDHRWQLLKLAKPAVPIACPCSTAPHTSLTQSDSCNANKFLLCYFAYALNFTLI